MDTGDMATQDAKTEKTLWRCRNHSVGQARKMIFDLLTANASADWYTNEPDRLSRNYLPVQLQLLRCVGENGVRNTG